MRPAAVSVLALCAACSQHPQDAPPLAAMASAEPSASGATTSASTSSSATHPEPAPSASSALAVEPPAARLYVRARNLAIHGEPSLKSKPIGTLVAGDAVALRSEEPKAVPGCSVLRAIAPRGWVCTDGEAATLDAGDPVWAELHAHAPDYASPWPYVYGESRGVRRHPSVPGLEGPSWPASLFDTHVEIPRRSTVAWLDELQADGTSWLRVDDMTYVRKDRVTPFARSDFQGIKLGGTVSLPLAFFKRAPHAKLTRDASGRLVPSGETWPRLGWVALTGRNEKHGGHLVWETREEGTWLDGRDAAVVAPDGSATPAGPHTTWVEVAALQGWLVAYEQDTPVFATMISAGKLGAAKPHPDHEPHQPAATTPIGTYRIREKLLTATLQSDLDDGTEFVHAQVPWSQRFYDKYLLHTAYWHDQWGEGHSGGCVNLSPTDARWLFGWTEPKLPEGWHAVRAGDPDDAPSTIVVIHP
jgi:hypothetical protein